MSIRIILASAAWALAAASSVSQAQPAPAASAPATAASTAAMPAAAPNDATSSEGKVAYYGRKFQGRKTASGERFNSAALTMAHKTLPFGTMVRVTNLKNNKSVIVRVNDRGPSTAGRVGDLSVSAARALKMLRAGVIDAKLEVVGTTKPRKASKKA